MFVIKEWLVNLANNVARDSMNKLSILIVHISVNFTYFFPESADLSCQSRYGVLELALLAQLSDVVAH